MPSQRNDPDDMPQAGGAERHTSGSSMIFEVAYPDEKRLASGEPPDEALSRAYFVSRREAEVFARREGGEVIPRTVSGEVRRELYRRRMLG